MSADAQARWFRTLFEHARCGIAIVDLEDHIVDANPALAELLGVPAEQLRGSLFTDHAIHDADEDRDRTLFEAVASGASPGYSVERRYRRADGTTMWARTSAWLVHGDDGAPDRVLGMLDDITAARRAEQQLREQAELARLGEMAAVVAHEVKNPLTGIGGVLQIMRDRLPEDSGDRQLLAEIHSRLRALNATVEDLLLFARPMTPQLGPLSLRELIVACVRDVAEQPDAADVLFDVEGTDVTLIADRALLVRLFRSLLVNAAQAMGGAGTVEVRLAASPGAATVVIADSGDGLDDETAARMFEPFFTTKSHGPGLGLAIARKIAEAHSGSIEPGTEPAIGARFSVVLPRDPTGQS